MTPTTFAITRNNMKYIQYHGVWDIKELYDLNNDPLEMVNLIDDVSYLRDKAILWKALHDNLKSNNGFNNLPYTHCSGAGVN